MISCQIAIVLMLSMAMLSLGKTFDNSVHTKKSTTENSGLSRKDLIINGITGEITNRDWRQQVTQAQWPLSNWLSDLPTNVVRCRLFCKTGYHLQMRRSGVVSGTFNQHSKYTIFDLQSFGPSIIRIRNVATNRYIIMKKNGCFTGSRDPGTLQSLFRETHQYNAFNSYASVKYFHKTPHDMFLGIKHNGKIKRAMKTHRAQSATQFLVIKI